MNTITHNSQPATRNGFSLFPQPATRNAQRIFLCATIFFSLLFFLPAFAQDFTATSLGDFGNVTVMEVTGNYDANTPEGELNRVPRQVIANTFFETHQDDYDFLTIFTNFDFEMLEKDANAFYTEVKNDVHGIGRTLFDNSGLYGSNGRLQGTIDMGNALGLPVDPADPKFNEVLSTLSHEFLHRWGAHVRFKEADGTLSTALLGEGGRHWSYLLDTGGSVLYGHRWQDNGDGTFTAVAARKYFSPLDLYLMGFIDKSQVPPMRIIESPGIDPNKLPELGATISGIPRTITIDDIIAAEGERVPNAADAQKNFKMAFILVTAPGTFNGSELFGIENIRNGWVTQFSILNDGQGIVQVAATLREDLPTNPGVTLPPLDPRTLPPDIHFGVFWLIGNQGTDGSWMDLVQTKERDTSEVLLTLESFPVAQPQYLAGLQWLRGAPTDNLDYLVRKMEVLYESGESGEDVSALTAELLSRQNPDGGWGSNTNYLSNPVDTAIALKVLARIGYSGQAVLSQAIAYLESKQHADGGWGGEDTGSMIQATANVLSAFNTYRGAFALDAKVDLATTWLVQRQNPDGGFGNSPSTVYDTALALLALRELDASTEVTNLALNYLLSVQSIDGSWYASPYQTALAVHAVSKATIDPDLSIKASDIIFIPSTVTRLPEDIVINADIWNLGQTAVSQAAVALYDGEIAAENKVAEQVVAFPGQSSVTVTFLTTIVDGNEHRFHFVVDPEDLVKESNETNNTALVVLFPETTYDFEILPADVTISAATIDFAQEVTLGTKITNRGTVDAQNVQVRYFIDEPGGGFEIATTTVDIPAGVTIADEVTWQANKTGVNLPIQVTADPFDTFAEFSEINNMGSTSLTVNAITGPNLTLSPEDIVVDPVPANEGGNATITAFVGNEGFSTANDIAVNIYKGVPGAGGVLLGSGIIASLAPGERGSVLVDWIHISESGEKIVYVEVDPENLIAEFNELDNHSFTTINISSLPDLTLSTQSILFTPAAPKEGDTVSIQVTVQNSGDQVVSDVTVSAEEGGVLGTQTIPLIAGHSQADVSFAYDTTGKVGPHAITVRVDPGDTIIEQNEANNVATRTFGVQDASLWLTEPYFSPNGDGVKDSTQFFFRLTTPQTVTVGMVNEKGETVRTFGGSGFENVSGGNLTWDGLDTLGRVVEDGPYQIQVRGVDNSILGSLVVVVDNNRSPLYEDIESAFLLESNLTCQLPNLREEFWDWLPNESGLVFTISVTNPNFPEYPAGVYTMGPDGNDILRIIPEEFGPESPEFRYGSFRHSISPDGEKVAFAFEKFDKIAGGLWKEELWVVDIDGNNLTLLATHDAWSPFRLEWSPDSQFLMYVNARDIRADISFELWAQNVETSERTLIDTTGYYRWIEPNKYLWSPDGQQIGYLNYFDCSAPGREFCHHSEELRVSDLAGNKKTVYSTFIFYDYEHTDKILWLEDQKMILIGVRHIIVSEDIINFSDTEIWFVDTNNSDNNKIVSDYFDFEDYTLLVAPDRKSILFNSTSIPNRIGLEAHIKSVNTDGEVRTIYERMGELREKSFFISELIQSPNSQEIAFIETVVTSLDRTIELKIVNLDTGELDSFDFTKDGISYLFDWLPDGRSIITPIPSTGNPFGFPHDLHLIDTQTGELTQILSDAILPFAREKFSSPLQERFTFYRKAAFSPNCNPLGFNNLWTASSLLNLTADLRATKEESAVVLKGVATDLYFDRYILEYADIKDPGVWNLVKPPSDVPVSNGVLAPWVPPYEGTFFVRLTVSDKAGNVKKEITRVSWGLFSNITNIYKDQEIISPNGDGVKDHVQLHYRVTQPVHLEFEVYDGDEQIIRTFIKGHTIPTEDLITWDGRDGSGNVVPDGNYKIKVFDYAFFVEVDNTIPDVQLAFSQGDLNGVTNGNIKQYIDLFELYIQLGGHAVDNNLNHWVIEYGEGPNPQEWIVYDKGEKPLVPRLVSPRPGVPPIPVDLVVGEFTSFDQGNEAMERLVGKKFRITGEDLAGNRRTEEIDFAAQQIVFYKWNKLAFKLGSSLFGTVGGLNLVGVRETIREPLAGLTVQYLSNNAWQDSTTLTPALSGEIEIPWDSSLLNPDVSYRVRIKAVDILGNVYYSNEAFLPGRAFSIRSACPVRGSVSARNLFEGLVLLKFQYMPKEGSGETWTDFKAYDTTTGDLIPTGAFNVPLPNLGGDPYTIRMFGVGLNGEIFVSEMDYPINCGKAIEFSFGVTYDKAPACDLLSGKASISAGLTKGTPDKLISLTYYLNKPQGEEVLRQIDLSKEKWSRVDMDTSSLSEGSYPVRAELVYLDQGSENRLSAHSVLLVDRVLPTAQITYPGPSLKLCPQKITDPAGVWSGISVEGTALDDNQVKEYRLFYGVGENPETWFAATTRKEGEKVPIFGDAVQGQLGIWDVTDLKGETFTLKLEVIDLAGNVRCYTVIVHIDGSVEIVSLTQDIGLVSPNGDGLFDEVKVTYQVEEQASVDIKVYPLLTGPNGESVLDATPVRTIAVGVPHPQGTESALWDGQGDTGGMVPDGRYAIAVSATDSCGNTTLRWTEVTVDNTPPTAAITYPTATDPLGNIVEVSGTGADLHFQDYTVEVGEGDLPDLWVLVASKTIPVNNGVLGKWNSFEQNGRWTLRLTASDTVGNRNEARVTLDLGARQTLIKDLEAVPGLFSPNGDGKIDSLSINYELTDAADVLIEITDTDGVVQKSHTTTVPVPGVYAFLWEGQGDNGNIVADGPYTINVTATLSSNTAITHKETVTVTVDTVPPSITMKQPLSDAFINTDVTVNGTIQDDHLQEYTVSYTGGAGPVLIDQDSQTRNDYPFGILSDLSDGAYTLNVSAKDLGENTTEENIPFTIDRTPPQVTLDLPKEGEYFGFEKSPINIEGSIVEENLESYIIRYGPGENPAVWTPLFTGSVLPTVPALLSWNVGENDGIPDGLYTLSLLVIDKAGFETEATAKVTIDNTAPEVMITSLLDGDYVKEAIEIAGTATDTNLDRYTVAFSEGLCDTAFKWASIQTIGQTVGQTTATSVQDGLLANWQILPADGEYCLRLTAVDLVGNQGETKVQIKIDTLPPSPPVLSGEVENGTGARLSWTAGNELDLAGYNLYRGNEKINANPLTETHHLDSDLAEGGYAYTVKAVDLAGWESDPSNEIIITVDVTGPKVKIQSPRDGSKVSGILDIKGTAHSPEDFKQYRVFIGQGANPSSWTLIRTSPIPLSFGTLAEWETLGLSEGPYGIKLEGEDLIGNISTHQVTVTIDNTPPAPPLLISAVPSASDVTVSWQANTDTDLAGYLLYRNGQLANAAAVVIGDLKPFLMEGTTYLDQALPDGAFAYYAVAMDQAGNVSDPSNSLELNLDTHPPQATIVEPTEGTLFEDRIRIKAETSDLDIATIQFQYKEALLGAWTDLGAPIASAPFITHLDPTALSLSYGDYQLRGVAVDNGGKVDPAPASITVTYRDLTPPAPPVNLTALTDGADVALTWTANSEGDLDGYNLYNITGGGETKINPSIIKETTYPVIGLTDGDYTYEIRAVDTFGNESGPSNAVPVKIYGPVLTQPYTPSETGAIPVMGTGAAANASVEVFYQNPTGLSSAGTTQADEEGSFTLASVSLVLGENRLVAKATDGTGNISKLSDPIVVVFNESPSQPTGLLASVLGFDVTLTWNPNGDTDLLGYHLYREGQKVNLPEAVTTGNATASYSTSFNTPSKAFDSNPDTYWFSPSTSGGNFNPVWWEINFLAPILVNRLEILWRSFTDSFSGVETIYAGRDYEIQVWSGYAWVTWKKITGNLTKENAFDFDPAYRADRVRIYITDTTDPTSSKQVFISEVNVFKDNLITQTSYNDLSLPDGSYQYTLTAVDAYGFESLPSDPVDVVVGDVDPPTAPSNLTAVVQETSSLLSWSASPESDVTGYIVYRRTATDWVPVNASPVAGTTYTDTPLPNGLYTYRITAVDGVGNESLPSNEATANIAIALPSTPDNLLISSLPEGGALAASWEYAGSAVAGYHLYRSSESGGPYTQVHPGLLGSTSYVDRGLTDGITFYYIVAAVDVIGNEGSPSIEASGLPADTVAPEQPVIFYPALAGIPAVLSKDQTDLSGSAEPGSRVDLYHDGVFFGEATALTEDLTQSFAVDYAAGWGASLSPDGRVLAYSYNGPILLKDLLTGEVIEAVPSGDSPLWSPDGTLLAYNFEDSEGSYRIGIYDTETGIYQALTEDPLVDERSPWWTADGKKLSFLSDRGGTRDPWVRDLASGSMTQINSGNRSTGVKISPDGQKVAYVVLGVLYVTDLVSGETFEVDSQGDGSSLDWSPGSETLAYGSFRNGNRDIFVLDIETRLSSQITTSTLQEESPFWSPDGKSLLFAQREGSARTLYVSPVPLQGQNKLIRERGFGVDSLFWNSSGAIVFMTANTFHRIDLEGSFAFTDIPLAPGENRFHAVATDASGNVGLPSEEVSIVFDTSLFPDLEILQTDLFIYPPFPIAGEEVTLGATIRNRGQATAESVTVHFYFWDAAGNLEFLKSERISSIGPNSAVLVSARWDSTGKLGANTLILVADPEELILESLETNNFVTHEIPVSTTGSLSMTTSLGATQYLSGQDVNVSVQLLNSGLEREVDAEVWIEDEGGTSVTLLDSFRTSVPYGIAQNYSLVWNTGSTYAGLYRVHTVLRHPPDILAENTTPFGILPDIAIGTTVATDKVTYQPEEDVGIQTEIGNTGRNYIIPRLQIKTKVVDWADQILFTEDREIRTLLPGASTTLSTTWHTGLAAPGDYQAMVEIYLDGQLHSTRSASFTVNASLVITGRLAVIPSVVLLGNTGEAGYTLQNRGNTDAQGLILQFLVVDPESQVILQVRERAIDLGVSGETSGQFVFTTEGLDQKTYTASLRYLDQGSGRTIAAASFTVRDGIPPTVTLSSPLPDSLVTSTTKIEAFVSDDASGVDFVEYRIDQNPWRLLRVADLARGRYSVTWTPSLTDVGERTIAVRATDKSGNRSSPVLSTVTVAFPPSADAGPDQTVNEGDLVTLDGSGSSSVSGNPLTFQWEQIAGPPVSLDLTDPVHPFFISPAVPVGGATLTFGLTVDDGLLSSALDVVNVTVKNVNHPPVAEAGEAQTVGEDATVFLDGSSSFDPDGEPITYSWVQTAGIPVVLSEPTTARPSFIAPIVSSLGAVLVFELTVDDGIDTTSDSVQVHVENVNHPPIANAGLDLTRDEESPVTLDGTASSDPDGDALTYLWTQMAGPQVTLSDPQSPTPSFTAPAVGQGGETLLFQLVVNDGLAGSLPDEVVVTILNSNDPPVCGLAESLPSRLWPPNHKLIEITIIGVSDPENDPVVLTISGVTQDEPVNGTGDGDTAPDAVIQDGKVFLRTERSGGGNGRVYRISFTATDLDGGFCKGDVTVDVSHDSHPGADSVDDGQFYDSTGP